MIFLLISFLTVFFNNSVAFLAQLLPPTVTGISPDQVSQGQTLNMTITGTNFVDVQNVDLGQGITINGAPNIISPSELQVDITVDPSAILGPRDVVVTTLAGPSSGGNGLLTVTSSGGGGGGGGSGIDICANLRSNISPNPPIQVGIVDLDTGDLFQTWFFDVCVVDGFLSKVKEVDVVHKVEEVDTVHLIERFLKTGITTPTGIEVTASSTQTIDQILWEFMSKFKDYSEKFTFDFFQALFEKGLKVKVEDKLLEGIKAFELAKIEKAREDVNKLIQETVKELKDQPLVITDFSGERDPIMGEIKKVLRLRGLAVDYGLGYCPEGIRVNNQGLNECWVIKQSSRIVDNLDDYLYEEPLQKARDVIMCLLAPWNHFPLGQYTDMETATSTDDFLFGKSRGFCDEKQPYPYDVERDTVLNECSTAYICSMARRQAGPRPDMFSSDFENYKKDLCPSDRIKEDLKKEIITFLTRKHKFLDKLPPEIWYYGVSMYQGDNSLDWTDDEYDEKVSKPKDHPIYVFNKDFCKFETQATYISKNNCLPYDYAAGVGRCTFILENLVGSGQQATLSQFLVGVGPSPIWNDFLDREIREFFPTLPLSLEIKRLHRLSIDNLEYQLAQENKNNLDGLKKMIYGAISTVITQIKEKNTLKFSSGAGIKPLQYLVGWNVCEDANKIESLKVGAGQRYCNELNFYYQVCQWENDRCDGSGYYYFETDDIISPAIFLLNKISASIFSEFALAMMAWKKEPESIIGESISYVCPEPSCIDVYQAAYGDSGDDNVGAIASSDTMIAVTNNTIFYVGDIIFIDENGNGVWDKDTEEVMRVVEDRGSELLVERALYGTNANTYTAGHNIFRFDANIYNCWRFEPRDDPKYCAFTVRNDLTGKVFRPDLKMDLKERKIVELPEKLPAPWEDLGRYLNLKDGFTDFIDNYCPKIKNQDNCTKQLYLNGGGAPFCTWDPNANNGAGLCKYRGSILTYDSESPLIYDTESPPDAYRNYRIGERKAPEYIGRGQYFNRLYREGIQLFEKPMDQMIIDWFEPENRCLKRPLGGKDPCGTLATNPECIIDTGMNVCRLKTCEEIDNITDPNIRRKACNANPICLIKEDLLDPNDPVCRRK